MSQATDPPAARPVARGWTAAAVVLLVSWPLAMVYVWLAARSGRSPDGVAGPTMMAYAVVALVAAARASRHCALDVRTRRAWRILAVALVLTVAANVLFGMNLMAVATVMRVVSAPVLFVALLTFPVRPRAETDGMRLLLDIGIVVAGGFVLLWYFSLGPAVVAQGLPGDVLAVAVAYPLLDLALLVVGATALLRGAASDSRPLQLLVAGMGTWVLADIQYGDHLLRLGRFGRGPGALEWFCLVTTFFLVALAAVEQCRVAGRHTLAPDSDPDVRPASSLPYFAVALAFALLILVAWRAGLYPWGGLVAGTMLMTAGVLARQVLTLRDNHALAISDQLTGLASRSRLRAAAADALATAKRSGQPAAVLVIDLDGFKEVNDTLGHEVGDEVLVAFADLLRAVASRSDTVGRIGGDEFAVVLPAVGSMANAGTVVQRIIAGMEHPVVLSGRTMRLHASIGIAMSEPRSTVGEILDGADQAMYEAKREQSTGWAWHIPGPIPPDLAPPLQTAAGG